MRMVLALLVAAAVVAPAWAGEQDSDGGGYSSFAIGLGRTYRGDPDGGLGLPRGSAGFEARIGTKLGDHGAIFLYSGFAIDGTDTGVDFARWVFQDDEYLATRAFLLWWLIPFAFLLDSHAMVGPGIAFFTSADAPSFFFEVGGGISSNQSVADSIYALGGGIFGGAGAQITRHVGVLVRTVWAPSSLGGRWTSWDGDLLSVLAMLQFR